MTVKELVLKLNSLSQSENLEIKVCKTTELIGGRCMHCLEDFDIDSIENIIAIVPKGKNQIYDDIKYD